MIELRRGLVRWKSPRTTWSFSSKGEAADEEVVPNVVAEPPSYTNQAVSDMTPDQAHAAVARGLLTVSQMYRLLDGPWLTNKELPRSLLAAEAKATTEIKAAEAAKMAAAEAKAAAETKAAAGTTAAEEAKTAAAEAKPSERLT